MIVVDAGAQNGPYTKEEASVLRALRNEQIVGCWWCVTRGELKPYWPEAVTEFRQHRIICPKHRDQEGQGLLDTQGSGF